MVRIIKPDESTDLVTINGPSGEVDKKTWMQKVYDLSVGTYDVTVSVGPGYQTKRQENLALLESLMQGPMGQLLTGTAPDLIASMMDFQIAPQLVERLKKTLPPALQDKPEGAPGQGLPPELMAQIQQKEQQSGQMIEQLTQKVHELADQLESKQAETDAAMAKAQLDSQTKIAIAQMDNETKLLLAREQMMAKGADQALQAKIAQLEAEQADLQELALHMHTAMQSPQEEAQEPVQEAPQVEAAEPKPDPMHMLLSGHTAALQGIAEALKRSGAPRKRTLQMDANGKPIGIVEEEA